MDTTHLTRTADLEALHTDDSDIVLTYHVMGILQQDYRTWSKLIREHARDGFSVPRSKQPHLHPHDVTVPCMFCAANCGDISVVSASVFTSITERKLRDDEWNTNPERSPKQVMSACKTSRPNEDLLVSMFGPRWMAVLALAYRLELADARSLVELLTQALRIPRTSRPDTGGPDWGIQARWIVARAMVGKYSSDPVPMAVRLRRREAAGHLGSLAGSFAVSGLPPGDLEPWLVLPT